jgi:signal transduction histidine kinase
MADMYEVELVANLHGYEVVEGSFDRVLIARALGALLDNAIRATPEGGRVAVSVELTGAASDMARLSVCDQGPGFTAEPERLLVPFVVGDRVGRLGLGLAVAQAISAAHGGHIQISSGAEGATVTMEIELG